MNPVRCNHEHETSAAIERWEEIYRVLKEEDRELELPDSWKMTALQSILCGEIPKSVEYREKDFKTYDELRSTVMRWAINKKIENERTTQGDPMECNQAEQSEKWWECPPCGGDCWNPTGAPAEEKSTGIRDIDYTGKGGKGKEKGSWGKSNPFAGKGRQWSSNPMQMIMMGIKAMKGGKAGGKGGAITGKGGGCFNCGKTGHRAFKCPAPKNIETRSRNRCGKQGHLMKDCQVAIREVEAADENAVVWGTCMVDEIGDLDTTDERESGIEEQSAADRDNRNN